MADDRRAKMAGLIDGWWHKLARWSWLLVLVGAVGHVVAHMWAGIQWDVGCGDGSPFYEERVAACRGLAVPFTLAISVTLIIVGTALGLWTAALLRILRRRSYHRTLAPRLEAYKDWLVHGRIKALEYERLVAPPSRLIEMRFGGERLMTSGQWLWSSGLLISAWAG